LEAQARQACSSEAATASSALQPEKQGEPVTMETQSSPGLPMRKSVSIAVSTGRMSFLKKKWSSLHECFCDFDCTERECTAEMLNVHKHVPQCQQQLSSLGVICEFRLQWQQFPSLEGLFF